MYLQKHQDSEKLQANLSTCLLDVFALILRLLAMTRYYLL